MSALELALLQLILNYVQFLELLAVGSDLPSISHSLHDFISTAHFLHLLEQFCALFHDISVDLDASLLGRS